MEFEIIISLVLFVLFFTLSNIPFVQSSDLSSVMDKATNSLQMQMFQRNITNQSQPEESDSAIPVTYKSYDNTTYGVSIKYPKSWKWTYQDREYYASNPQTIFNIIFVSPSRGDVNFVSLTININNLEPPATNLEEFKEQTLTLLKESYPDIKNVILFQTTLAGSPAYKIEYTEQFLDYWKKNVSTYLVKDTKVYSITALAKPEDMKRYSKDIKNMIDSLRFEEPK